MTLFPRAALQLYSIRTLLEEDFSAALDRVVATGFTAVELYNLLPWADRLKAELPARGLEAPTAHARLLGEDQERIFATAAELGVGTIIDPHVARERWTTAAEVERIAEDLGAAQRLAASYGLDFGYHNHFWEVANRIDGVTALEHLAQHLADGALLEVDAYWAAIGGADVPALLTSLGERVRFLHLKDAPLTAEGALSDDRLDQLPIGEGALPWDAILAAAPSAELLVVEFDEFRGDVVEAAGRSLRALEQRGVRA